MVNETFDELGAGFFLGSRESKRRVSRIEEGLELRKVSREKESARSEVQRFRKQEREKRAGGKEARAALRAIKEEVKRERAARQKKVLSGLGSLLRGASGRKPFTRPSGPLRVRGGNPFIDDAGNPFISDRPTNPFRR